MLKKKKRKTDVINAVNTVNVINGDILLQSVEKNCQHNATFFLSYWNDINNTNDQIAVWNYVELLHLGNNFTEHK